MSCDDPHAVTFVNTLDLGGEQRYIRVDGSGSGTERGAFVIVAGDILNGSIVKRGGGALIFESPKSYENGTLINQGMLWLRGTGTAGANVSGNDIQVGSDGYLRIESPTNIGSRQMIIMQNTDVNTPAVISFGAGYGTGADIRFSSLTATGGILGTGGGGNPYLGKREARQLLDQGKTIELISASDVPDDALVATVGSIGAPVVSNERLKQGDEFLVSLRALETHLGRTITHVTCAEIGGSNSMSPCLLYTYPNPRDRTRVRMPSSA